MQQAMNYIAEINAFHKSLARTELSVRAIAIWLFLMDKANDTGWKFPLHLSEMEIRGVMSMGHEAFLNARKELADNGYIKLVSQTGRKKPHYYILPIVKPQN